MNFNQSLTIQFFFLSLTIFIDRMNRLTVEMTNQKNEIMRKEQDYTNFLRMYYEDIFYCTECLSNQSNRPFLIEPATPPRDDIELYSSKLKVKSSLG